MTTIYHASETSIEALRELPVGIVGYGNQGRAHALNLRDSGLSVMVGTRDGSPSRVRAKADGFAPHTISELTENCPVLAIMLPDEVIAEVYVNQIEPYLKSGSVFIFAHGFVVRHNLIMLPDDADVILVAPTGPGHQLRKTYEAGHGLPALIGVGKDSSGVAWDRCLAYAHGIGSTRAGAIKTTFEEETVVDLFCEQAVLCGGMPELIKASFDTLVERGYPSELAYISCLKEVKLIADLLFTQGIDGMRSAISNTAKFGSAVAGPIIINTATISHLKQILSNIENGEFARQFAEDTKRGSPQVRDLVSTERHSRLSRVGRQLQEELLF